MSESKPCPFCGNEPVVEGNLVACNNLNCPTHDNYWTDPMIFTCDQWNTRPLEDALNKRIARAKELLDAEMLPYKGTRTIDLPDHYLQLQQVIDVLNGGGE